MTEHKPPIASEHFCNVTAILPYVIADVVLQEKQPHGLTGEQIGWFINHCDTWIRWYYANNEKWRRQLRGTHGRDHCYTFIRHWADAFIKNPAQYQKRHPLKAIGGSDDRVP